MKNSQQIPFLLMSEQQKKSLRNDYTPDFKNFIKGITETNTVKIQNKFLEEISFLKKIQDTNLEITKKLGDMIRKPSVRTDTTTNIVKTLAETDKATSTINDEKLFSSIQDLVKLLKDDKEATKGENRKPKDDGPKYSNLFTNKSFSSDIIDFFKGMALPFVNMSRYFGTNNFKTKESFASGNFAPVNNPAFSMKSTSLDVTENQVKSNRQLAEFIAEELSPLFKNIGSGSNLTAPGIGVPSSGGGKTGNPNEKPKPTPTSTPGNTGGVTTPDAPEAERKPETEKKGEKKPGSSKMPTGKVLGRLGAVGIAIGAALEIPDFVENVKKWWEGSKWGGWEEAENAEKEKQAKSVVEPMPAGNDRQNASKRRDWMEKYGETHNPDGTPKSKDVSPPPLVLPKQQPSVANQLENQQRIEQELKDQGSLPVMASMGNNVVQNNLSQNKNYISTSKAVTENQNSTIREFNRGYSTLA